MTAPDGSTAPEGVGTDSTDEAAVQQALADAAQAAAGTDDDDDDEKFDADRARKKIEKQNRENAALRARLKAVEPLAAEAEKRRKNEQTETERLAEEKAALQARLAELETANVRRDAAEAAGLPSKFLKFITAAEADEALAQAKELAKELKPAEQQKPADLRQGARGTSNAGSTNTSENILRRMMAER